jgi:hypothetical protein
MNKQQLSRNHAQMGATIVPNTTLGITLNQPRSIKMLLLLFSFVGSILTVNPVSSFAQCSNNCDLINNGNIESSTGCAPIGAGYSGNISCWSPLVNTPYALTTGSCSPAPAVFPDPYGYTNTGQIYLASQQFYTLQPDPNNVTGPYILTWSSNLDGMQTTLNSPLVPYTDYTLSFWAKAKTTHQTTGGYATSVNDNNAYLEFGMRTSGPPSLWTGKFPTLASNGYFNSSYDPLAYTRLFTPAAGSSTPTHSRLFIPADEQWHYYTLTFTYQGPPNFSNLCIQDGSYIEYLVANSGLFNTNYLWKSEIYVDNISLKPAALACTFLPPTTVGNCHAPIDLSKFVTIPGGTFSSTASGVLSTSSGTTSTYNMFDPSAVTGTLPATVTFAYTYTSTLNGSSCTQTTYAQITVSNSSAPTVTVTPTSATACPTVGRTITASATPSTCSYNWVAAAPASAVTNPTSNAITVYPNQTSTYNVTVTDPTTGCTATASSTITVPTMSLDVIDRNNVYCDGIDDPNDKHIGLVANITPTPTSTITYNWSSNPSFYFGSGATSATSTTTPGNNVTGWDHNPILITVIAKVDGCSLSATTGVVRNDGSCVCTLFGTSKTAIGVDGKLDKSLNYSTSSTPPVANYFLNNNVTVHGNITIYNAVILVSKDVKIIVDPNSTFTLDNCHVFTCDNEMWTGIQLANSTTSTGKFVSRNKTMIEDAYTTVWTDGAVPPVDGSNIIDVSSTVFNRNGIVLDIENYTPEVTGAPYVYPFSVKNCVFTSRDFSGHSYGGVNANTTDYPFTWPLTNGGSTTPKGLMYGYDPYTTYGSTSNLDKLRPPYTIDAPNAYATGTPYNVVDCKDMYQHREGVRLNNVGYVNTSGSYNIFSEAQVGIDDYNTPPANRNLFDYLNYGIHAYNSNFTSVNNVYMNMQKVRNDKAPPTAVGAEGSNSDGGQNYLGRARVYNNYNTTGINEFYDCRNGIYVKNYTNVLTRNAILKSTHGNASPQESGLNGITVNSWKIRNIDIGYNALTNIINGINVSVNMTGTSSTPQQQLGNIDIGYNSVKASTTFSGITQEYCNTAINVNNLLTDYNYSKPFTPSYAQVNVHDNAVNDAYNGIYVANFSRQGTRVADNNLSLRQLADKTFQYGVEVAGCVYSLVRHNDVVVDNYNSGTINDVTWKGIYMSNCKTATITCNMTDGMGTGIEYLGNNPGTRWTLNNMYKHGRGYVLNNGSIGVQTGLNSTPGSPQPIDNQWLGSTWTGSHVQTYTINASPLNSKLYVRSGTALTNPINNTNSQGYIALTYSSTNGLVTLTPSVSIPKCADLESYIDIRWNPFNPLYVALSKNEPDSDATPQVKWISQFGVWQALLADSTLADSSAELTVFKTLASKSRYAYITTIEDYIANEDYHSALGLISDSASYTAPSSWVYDSTTGVVLTDDADADNIIANYLNFYTLYINYRTSDTLAADDTTMLTKLAFKCPMNEGLVVYQARSLYNMLMDSLVVFDEDQICGFPTDTVEVVDTGAKHSNSIAAYNNWLNTQKGSAQQYTLSPNPNNGNITIAQKITDNAPVSAEVWNSIGQTTYKGLMMFNGNLGKLQLEGITPGLYVMLLMDSKGKTYTLKFIVNK